MRSTAPAAVAASISCSRARLVALRRQVRAVPAVHMTIGPISATQSSRFRSAPRCRSPQHARRREVPSRSTGPTTSATSDPIAQLGMSRRAGLHLADDRTDLGAGPNRLTRSRAPGLMSMSAARMRPAAISPAWCTAAGGTPERDDDDSGGDGDLHGSRCHAAPLPGQRSYAWDGPRKLSRRYTARGRSLFAELAYSGSFGDERLSRRAPSGRRHLNRGSRARRAERPSGRRQRVRQPVQVPRRGGSQRVSCGLLRRPRPAS